MPYEFSGLLQTAGITILTTILWAASIAFAFWDLNWRKRAGRTIFGWLIVVALVPFVGLAAYLIFRGLTDLLTVKQRNKIPIPPRETILRKPGALQSPTSTIFAADLAKETVINQKMVQVIEHGNTEKSEHYILTICNGPNQGKEFIIENLPVVIGRGSEAGVSLHNDLGVSRRHAELYKGEGSLRIKDLNSTHGSIVNGSRIEEKQLAQNDKIRLGKTVLEVKIIERTQ